MNNTLNSLKDIASAVTYAAEAGSLEQVLEKIALVSSELVGARYAALGVPDSRGGLQYFKVAGMTQEQVRAMGHLPQGKGLLGVIMKERKTLRLDRIQDEPRSAGFCEGHPVMTTLLGVPIQIGDRLFGMLYLCDRLDGLPFTQQDEWLVETLAGYAALAIAGSLLGQQQSRLVLLEERERIGMELHDGIIQALYAVGMHLELARTSGDLKPIDLERAVADLNGVIEDIRRYILDLKARDHHQQSVRQCIEGMISRLHIPPSLAVEISAPDTYPPFPHLTFDAVCQIINEAVSNVIRHAEASQLTITTREEIGLFQVTISDNGKGFDLQEIEKGRDGLGLKNMHKRAHLYGGRVAIDTAPGQGTRVVVTLPT